MLVQVDLEWRGSANSSTDLKRPARAKLRNPGSIPAPTSLHAAQLERAIGPEVLDTLSKQTGLSRDELLRDYAANFRTPLIIHAARQAAIGSGIFACLRQTESSSGDKAELHSRGMWGEHLPAQ